MRNFLNVRQNTLRIPQNGESFGILVFPSLFGSALTHCRSCGVASRGKKNLTRLCSITFTRMVQLFLTSAKKANRKKPVFLALKGKSYSSERSKRSLFFHPWNSHLCFAFAQRGSFRGKKNITRLVSIKFSLFTTKRTSWGHERNERKNRIIFTLDTLDMHT